MNIASSSMKTVSPGNPTTRLMYMYSWSVGEPNAISSQRPGVKILLTTMRSASSALVDTSLIGPACMQTVQIPRSGSSGLPSSPSVFAEENMMPPQFGQIPMKCGPNTIGDMEFDETM